MVSGTSEAKAQEGQAVAQADPKSVKLASKGVHTSREFPALMSAIMSDVLSGALGPNVATAACNAGGKLLKVVEMQYRYGKGNNEEKVLELMAPVAAE